MKHLIYLLKLATNTKNDIGTRYQAALEIMEIDNAVIRELLIRLELKNDTY